MILEEFWQIGVELKSPVFLFCDEVGDLTEVRGFLLDY